MGGRKKPSQPTNSKAEVNLHFICSPIVIPSKISPGSQLKQANGLKHKEYGKLISWYFIRFPMWQF